MSQLIVTIEDTNLLSQIKKAISLLKGVSAVKVKKTDTVATLNKTTLEAMRAAENGETIKCESFEDYLQKEVVVDTAGPFIYLGTLKIIEKEYIELENADVHDIHDFPCTKEKYLRNALVTGIRPNRKSCRIDKNKIMSVTLFSEIEKI